MTIVVKDAAGVDRTIKTLSDMSAAAGAVDANTQRMTLASDDPAVASLAAMDDWDDSDAAKVALAGKHVSVTLSLDTNAYVSGDVLADTQVVADCFRKTDGTGTLASLVVIDKDDQKQALDLLFFSANVALGTENSAPSISDANAANFLGKVSVLESDYVDLGGVSVATINAIGLGVVAASGADDMYVAAISRGTGTYTASGVIVRLYVQGD